MTLLARFIRDLLERLLGRFHEGPEPPKRITEQARLFRSLARETPTEDEWEAFTVELAEAAYRDGYLRGLYMLERSEFSPARYERELEEQTLAADPKWAAVLAEPMSARRVKEWQDAIGHAAAAGMEVHSVPDKR